MSKWGNNTTAAVTEIPDLAKVFDEATGVVGRILGSSKTMAETLKKAGRDPAAYLEAVEGCAKLNAIIEAFNNPKASKVQEAEVTNESPKLGG